MNDEKASEERGIESWPAVVQARLHDTHGAPQAVVPLAGLSGSRVWRVDFASAQRIVKATTWDDAANVVETGFYNKAASELIEQGVPVPALDFIYLGLDACWLAIEFIPQPLPRSRWLADPEVMSALHRLHNAHLTDPPFVLHGFHWTPAVHNEAIALPRSAQWVDTLRAACEVLFEEERWLAEETGEEDRWLSGDPNPRNWGVRADGSVALFDWERFTFGAPAIDLAITVPGLGTRPDFERVAERYSAFESPASTEAEIDALTRDLICAKAWSTFEFVAQAREWRALNASDARLEALAVLERALPDWFAEVVERALL